MQSIPLSPTLPENPGDGSLLQSSDPSPKPLEDKMCDTIRHPDPVRQLVHEWEHGAMSRREFFERALGLLGTITAANVLLAACSPAVVTPASTTAPAATSAPVATAAPTRAPAAVATTASQSNIPGF